MNSDQLFVVNDESAPHSVTVIAVTGQPVLVVSEHATVQQNPSTAGNGEEGEAMEVTECGKVNRGASCAIRTTPSQNPAESRCGRDFRGAPEKMTVPYKDIEPTTTRQFHFKRVVELAGEKPRTHFNPSFPQTLFHCGIEESVKVRLLVSDPEIGMIARHSVNRQLNTFRQRDEKVVKEYVSAFVDLLEPEKFEFVSLLGIHRFTVHDVAEKEDEEILWFVGLDERLDFACDRCQRLAGSLGVPSCRPSSKMEI